MPINSKTPYKIMVISPLSQQLFHLAIHVSESSLRSIDFKLRHYPNFHRLDFVSRFAKFAK
jgi:hypothetical protein